MKQLLLICAVVALVGCGGGVECFWCKEDIKEGALICKHCGKDPSENGAEQAPDRTKRPVDTWVSKRHKKQVKIIDVLTDVEVSVYEQKVVQICAERVGGACLPFGAVRTVTR